MERREDRSAVESNIFITLYLIITDRHPLLWVQAKRSDQISDKKSRQDHITSHRVGLIPTLSSSSHPRKHVSPSHRDSRFAPIYPLTPHSIPLHFSTKFLPCSNIRHSIKYNRYSTSPPPTISFLLPFYLVRLHST